MSTPRVLPAAPLSIESVVDQVYEAIRERITSGSLPRGDRILRSLQFPVGKRESKQPLFMIGLPGQDVLG